MTDQAQALQALLDKVVAGESAPVAHKFKNGITKTLNMTNAIKLLPFADKCPCCGKPTRVSIAEADTGPKEGV